MTPFAIPFEPLPPVSDAVREALSREAIRANDRYLYELVEGHAFCPFAKGGREAGQTVRYVVHADRGCVESIQARFDEVASNPSVVVAQVILPLVDVGPESWIRFCDRMTAEGHARRGGAPVLAFAGLHPRLAYDESTTLSLIPLFRRSPDPTIQWVKLDALAEIYEGRSTERVFIDPADILAFVRDAKPPPEPLYDRVARVNYEQAHRVGVARIAELAREQAEDARSRYERILAEAREGDTGGDARR